MQFSIDPKPIGAFIEYTIKPLIDNSRELVELLEKHEIKLGPTIKYAFKLYIIDVVARSVVTLISTGLICYTAWLCLHTKV